MPGVIFKDRAAKLASYDVFDELDVPVHIIRNPDSNDPRPLHFVSDRAYPDLIRLLNAACIAYRVAEDGTAAPELVPITSSTHNGQ